MRLPNLVVAVAVVCSMALTLLAQVSTIEGDVKGPDGSRAVGAVVKITRTDIKANYSVRTNKEGHYALNGLPVGTYNITVGVKRMTVTISGLRTQPGVTTQMNFDLQKDLAAMPGAAQKGPGKNTLTITSTPPGATVKFNDEVVGTTPYTVTYPGGYFREAWTIYAQMLSHPINAKIIKDGYIEVEKVLTDGPLSFVSIYQNRQYWLVTSNNFHFDLQPVPAPTVSSNPGRTELQTATTPSEVERGVSKCDSHMQNGELTLENGKQVAFTRLSLDKDDVGGTADRAYDSRSSCRPNMRYGEDLTESWAAHPERLPKFVFEDVVKIEFLPFTKDEMDQIKKGKTCVDVGCTSRRASVTFRDGTTKENIVIYLGDNPHYAITSDNRAYNLTDYDIVAVRSGSRAPAVATVGTRPAVEPTVADEVAKIYSGLHGKMPTAQRVMGAPAVSGRTTMTVKNSTAYELSVFFAGPVSQKLTLSPGSSQDLDLAPGTFRVGGRVAAPDVLPFYGEETYAGSARYSVEFYIAPQAR